MDTDTVLQKKVHHGRNVKRFREMFGIKQEILAEQLGISQQTISRFESQEELDEATLEKFAKALKVPVEAIKNFNEETAFNVISNTFTSNDNSTLNAVNHYCTFNPFEKIVRLYDEKTELYERMLKAEQEKIELLEQIVKDRR